MAIQIRGDQIQNAQITPAKIDLTGTFDFSSGTLQSGTPSATADVATKGYVDGQLPDSLQGGDGITINTGTSPDTIAVLLATNPGLQFSGAKLDLKLDGATLSKSATGVKIADAGIQNVQIHASAGIAITKLAQKTISGKDLGTNLDNLSAGNGLTGTAYNGAGPQSWSVDLDGASLAVGASGVKIADNGVGSAQIASSAVKEDKLGFQPRREQLVTNGSTTAFNLANRQLDANWRQFVMAFRNGIYLKLVASSPTGADEYTVTDNGTNTICTFGAAPASGDNVRLMYFA